MSADCCQLHKNGYPPDPCMSATQSMQPTQPHPPKTVIKCTTNVREVTTVHHTQTPAQTIDRGKQKL